MNNIVSGIALGIAIVFVLRNISDNCDLVDILTQADGRWWHWTEVGLDLKP